MTVCYIIRPWNGHMRKTLKKLIKKVGKGCNSKKSGLNNNKLI